MNMKAHGLAVDILIIATMMMLRSARVQIQPSNHVLRVEEIAGAIPTSKEIAIVINIVALYAVAVARYSNPPRITWLVNAYTRAPGPVGGFSSLQRSFIQLLQELWIWQVIMQSRWRRLRRVLATCSVDMLICMN